MRGDCELFSERFWMIVRASMVMMIACLIVFTFYLLLFTCYFLRRVVHHPADPWHSNGRYLQISDSSFWLLYCPDVGSPICGENAKWFQYIVLIHEDIIYKQENNGMSFKGTLQQEVLSPRFLWLLKGSRDWRRGGFNSGVSSDWPIVRISVWE